MSLPYKQIDHVQQVLMLSSDVRPILDLKNREISTNLINYFAPVICAGCLDIFIRIMNSMWRLQAPATMAELQSLLSLCNIFHRFEPNFNRVSAVFNKTAWKSQRHPFEGLAYNRTYSLNKITVRLVEPILLVPHCSKEAFTYDTD